MSDLRTDPPSLLTVAACSRTLASRAFARLRFMVAVACLGNISASSLTWYVSMLSRQTTGGITHLA